MNDEQDGLHGGLERPERRPQRLASSTRWRAPNTAQGGTPVWRPGRRPAFCACKFDRPGGSGEYNLMGELSETERKRTKEKENKFAFFCFLSLFGIGTFQWVTAEKSGKKFLPSRHSPQGCIFRLARVACLFIDRPRPRIRSCTNAIAFEFSHAYRGSYSVICWYGPFPIAPRIHFGGSTCWPQASRARRQPR